MGVDRIRHFCLSLPEAKENLQWGENLCFKVRGKLFAILDLGAVPQTLMLKCDPERFAELLEREGIIPAPYLGRYKWAQLERLGILRGDELEDLIRQSYNLVAAKTTRRRSRSNRAPRKLKRH
jgi:predicted DNA-binding protein (MmcQ/YjbR family)